MNSNWQVDFFQGIALDLWRLATPPEQTEREVDFLEAALCAAGPAQILDVPCGNGRHARALAQRGHRVTGIDLSREFIEEAQSTTGSLPADFIQADMRSLPWKSEFDGAYCFGNSFAYFNPRESGEFLQEVARTLKPGGCFALETGMCAESILPGLQNHNWYRVGDIYMLSENQYYPQDGRLDIQYTFIRGAQCETRPSTSYVLTVNELCRMHAQAGLQPLELLASVNRAPYGLGSQRLIVLSQKTLLPDTERREDPV